MRILYYMFLLSHFLFFSFWQIQNEGPILSHDPLPPADSIDIYSKPRTARRVNQSNSNLLSLFFSSIFMDLEGDGVVINGVNNENQK